MAGHEPAGSGRLSREEVHAEQSRVREQIDHLEAQRRQHEERLTDSIVAHLSEGFTLHTPSSVLLDVNPALCAMTGFAREELIGIGPPHPYWPPEERESIENDLRRHLEGATDTIEITLMRKDGERFPALVTPSVMRGEDGRPICVCATIKDISERRRAEQALRRSNRELQALTNCNQTLLRATDEETLLGQICRVVCDDAGYRLAWVGYAEHDEAKSVRPVAWAGVNEGYVETTNIVWADTERGSGPTGTAVRSGVTTYVQDYATDPHVVPWRENALRLGFRSAIALPLKDENADAFGALNIYSADPDAFTPDEVRLLEELAADLAFGITVLRSRIEREQTVQVLRESENRFRSLFEDSPVALWEDDYSAVKAHLEELAAGGIDDVIAYVLADPREYARCIDLCRDVDANKAAVRLFEAESREVLMARNSDLYRRESDRGIYRFWAAMLAGERSATFEEANLSLNGREIQVLETCTVVPGHEETYDRVYIADVDITERKRAEHALREREERLRGALSATVATLGATVAMRDPYTASHERRVSELACRIAERLDWGAEAIGHLRMAALVHDIGKSAVPAEILSKPTSLSKNEFELVKTHVAAAFEILAPIDFGGPVAEIVMQHHERLDGSGYPQGLRSEDILPGARVLAVADVVEAMITHRPYRPALPLEQALAEIGPESRGRFDAEAAEVCRKLFEDEGFTLTE